jgi:hypothetical protein
MNTLGPVQLEHRDDAARFVIATSNALFQERLAHLGYLAVGDGRHATRWFAYSPSVPRYFERFAAAIAPMVLQSARLVPIPWEKALLEFLRRVDGSRLDWWLYGSAALAIRGIDVEPGDIDVNVNDAEGLGSLLDDLLITPVEELDRWVARRIGRAFDGAIIEWASDPVAAYDDPAVPLEHGTLVADQLETVTWRGHRILVPPLWVQLARCEQRGLAERANLIRAAMA